MFFQFLRLGIFTTILCTSLLAHAQRTCGATELHQASLENPDYAKWFKKYTADLKTHRQQRVVDCSNPLIIPVAVHYSGSISSANPSCLVSRALDQVLTLNQDFGAYNSDITNYCTLSELCCETFPPELISQGSCIQFCLAENNHPACEPSGNLIGGYAITVGQHTWPSTSNNCWNGYLNFFVSDISPPGSANLLGLAPIAGGANPNGNGVYVTSTAFGGGGAGCNSGSGIDTNGTYNLGRTGTHEVGHYFGLDHIFEGCGIGDGIQDTPEQSMENFGCPTINTATCLSTAQNSCGEQDFFFNYMDYVNDACMYMFTEEQSAVMYIVAQFAGLGSNQAYASNTTVCDSGSQPSYTPTLPNGCELVNPPIPDSSFEPVSGSFTSCSNVPVEFTSNSLGCAITGWNWTFSGAGVNIGNSTDENPQVFLSQSGTLTVTLATSNAGGTDPTPASANYTVTIIDSEDPSCNDCGATLMDSGGLNGNYSNNENTVTTVCATDNSTVIINFFSFQIENEPNCGYDVLNVYDGATVSSPHIGGFCGNGTANAPGGGFITSSSTCMTFEFISDASVVASGWEAGVFCSTIVPLDLLSFTAEAKKDFIQLDWTIAQSINTKHYILERSLDGIDFKHLATIALKEAGQQSYSYEDYDLRNDTYYYRLKEVTLDESVDYSKIVSASYLLKDQSYKLYPNPSNGNVTLDIPSTIDDDINIHVYTKEGRLLKKFHFIRPNQKISLDLSDLSKGVYLLNIEDPGHTQMLPLVLLD